MKDVSLAHAKTYRNLVPSLPPPDTCLIIFEYIWDARRRLHIDKLARFGQSYRCVIRFLRGARCSAANAVPWIQPSVEAAAIAIVLLDS